MTGGVPGIVVLALGAGVLGVPDVLRLLIELAGRKPAVDIGICLFVFTIFTVQILGTVLLVRLVRKAPPGGGAGGAGRAAPRAPATDYFARITLVLSLAAASLVAACLLLVSGGGRDSVVKLVNLAAEYFYPVVIAAGAAAGGAALVYATPLLRLRALRVQRNARGANPERATTTHYAERFIGPSLAAAAAALLVAGGPGSLSQLVEFAAKNSIVAVIVGATAAGSLLRTMHPLRIRVFREQRNARRGAARAERATTTRHAARFFGAPLAAVCALLVAIASGARGGLDALHLRLSPGFINMPVAVAVAVVVGAALLLLVGFYRRARNAAGGGGGGAAARAPAAAAPRTRGASAK